MSRKAAVTFAVGCGLLAMIVGLVGCSQSTYNNRVVSAGDGMLSFTTEPFGSTVTTHRVTTDAAIRLDQRPVSLEELQNGDYVSLTIENSGNELVITSIDAISMENSQPGREMEPAHTVGGYDRSQDYPLPRQTSDDDPTGLERHR